MKLETEETFAVYHDGTRELIHKTIHQLPENEQDAAELAAHQRYLHGRRWDTETNALALQAGRGKGGRAPKYQPEIQALVNRLVTQDPDATVAELWERLPKSDLKPPYRYEDLLVYDVDRDGRDVGIKRTTFPRYVARARKLLRARKP